MQSSIPSEPDDASLRREEVEAAVMRHRHALRVGDAAGVGRTLDASARRPSERDLLVDLVAAEGLEPATRKLSRFWRDALTHVEAVRIVGPDEAEVYERVEVPGHGRPLDMVTLLRRGKDTTWRVVTTQRAPADAVRVQIWPHAVHEVRDDAFTRAFQRRFGPTGELLIDDDEGVLGHPLEQWVGALRTPKETAGPYELALVGEPEPDVRLRQVHWLTRCAAIVAALLGAARVYVPAARKVVSVETLDSVSDSDDPATRHVAAAWLAVHRHGPLVYTKGLGAFALAEVVATDDLWTKPNVTRQVVAGAAQAGLSGAMGLAPGEVVQIAGHRVEVETGPRGPSAQESFGRWGAVELVPASEEAKESGVVRRVP